VPQQRPATSALRRSLYEEATGIVSREYAAPLELDEIARRVASSRRQIQRVFSEIGHTTFREHLARVRMAHAAELLATAGPTVREVAARVGYRQPAQFAKAFRRHRGQAPAAYRAARLQSQNGSSPR
jgi:AraC family transcriptional regulator, regulatory protein of adaptative response / methylphosphotriester-DNA alkyltransferase methyltransferase